MYLGQGKPVPWEVLSVHKHAHTCPCPYHRHTCQAMVSYFLPLFEFLTSLSYTLFRLLYDVVTQQWHWRLAEWWCGTDQSFLNDGGMCWYLLNSSFMCANIGIQTETGSPFKRQRLKVGCAPRNKPTRCSVTWVAKRQEWTKTKKSGLNNNDRHSAAPQL